MVYDASGQYRSPFARRLPPEFNSPLRPVKRGGRGEEEQSKLIPSSSPQRVIAKSAVNQEIEFWKGKFAKPRYMFRIFLRELNLSSLYPQRWRNNSKTVIQGLWVYSIRQLEEEEEKEEEQFLQTRDCELLILSYFVAFKKIISNETWLIDTRVGYFYRLSRSREKLRDSVGDRNTVNDIDAV